ncbi:MAG TPA: MotA/TolQ/ExbB proton channel family protein [Bacteroidia bacterium]|jgi:biopolymer transport protein ExbB|nr:MotA/TolQ/ExbB proton channel family protein [Bacteroidia bacterium]
MLNFILQAGINPAATVAATDSINNAITGIQTATTAPEVTETKIQLLDMVLLGGPVMYILGFLFIAAVYVLVERLIVITKASKKTPTLLPGLKEMVHSGNVANARSMCKSVNTPESLMLEQGISRIGQSVQEIREAMTASGSNEISKLEKNLSILNITGRIAPMFGFIGTIFGVIKIFHDIAIAKTVEIEVISTGLYQKMITSAGGLVVGVLAFVAYHWLNARIDKLSHRMEESQIQFLDMLNEPSK